MLNEQDFMRYVAAFNLGDHRTCRSFYSPAIEFHNGAGARLKGPEAIIAYYQALIGRIARKMDVTAVIAGERALCAALHSRFEIISPAEDFAGETLTKGDVVLLDSMALYEVEGDRFSTIQAKSLSRRIVRAGTQP